MDARITARDDVGLIFARRFDLDMTAEIWEAVSHCKNKFRVASLQSSRPGVGHPDGCYGLWAGTCEALWEEHSRGSPYANAFFAEPDGVPLRRDWIDYLKRAHADTLATGKRITGARRDAGETWPAHVGGSLAMHLSCWADHPSLHACCPGAAWDCRHGQVLEQERGPNVAIYNLYGGRDMTPGIYRAMGRQHAWLSNMKDDSAWTCAQELLTEKGAES